MKTIHQILTLSAFFGLVLCTDAFAQSNDRIDELLGQEQARTDSAAYIVLSAGALISEDDTVVAAFEKAKELLMVEASGTPELPVRLDELGFMLMKSLSLKGGIMYTFFPGKRYAYRELVYKKIFDGTRGPSKFVSGEEVMRYLGYAFELKGGSK